MTYTKNYYHILGLATPSWGAKEPIPAAVELRRAYKLALLAAHPDKKKSSSGTIGKKTLAAYSVDEVKEAYTILAAGKKKAEYDNWLLVHHGGEEGIGNGNGNGVVERWQEPTSDFILGLELLDLSDFQVVDTPAAGTSILPPSTSASTNSTSTTTVSSGDSAGVDATETTAQTEWTRGCRCGADKGFRIGVDELEDAEERGETEVLVGCEGCSLWVRVGFEVEVEGG